MPGGVKPQVTVNIREKPRRRRRRGKRSGPPMAPVVTSGTRRTTFYRQYAFTTVVPIGDSEVVRQTINLQQIITKSDAKDVKDWFDEFRIRRVNIELLNYSTTDAEGPFNFYCVPDINPISTPTNISAMYNMTGMRCYTCTKSNFRSITLGTVKPVFDETGSNNHFVSDWLSISALQAAWYGFLLSVQSPESQAISTTILFRCWVAFRGFQ